MTLIESWSKEYLEMDASYENHINKFVHFIKQINKADKPTKININDVEDCIGYYNELGQINTVSSMENHLESIKSFYKFLVSKAWTTDIFVELYDYQGYKKYLTDKFNLEETKEREFFDQDVIKKIISCLDDYFASRILADLSGQKRKRYMSYVSLMLFIKLTLIAPAKRAIICNIKKADFSTDYRTLTINDVQINIPNGLRKEIIINIKLTEKLKDKKMDNSDRLFYFLNESSFRPEDLNSWFYNLLREFNIIDISEDKSTYPVETIRNSVIVELILKGFDLALISKVSGVSISTLENRYYKVKSYESEELNKLINEGIAGIPYYSYI
ncbi:integrase [Niallia sp. FSL W8-0951]|uniref:integrase n=1 Tax=Niallia sp. FSL W8-0951 TaxID=2954639 RepID=UPI0030FB4DBA